MVKTAIKQLFRRVPGLATIMRAIDGRDAVIARLAAENKALSRRNRDLTAVLIHGDRSGTRDEPSPDEFPMPSPLLRYLVAATENLDWFVSSGRLGAATVTDLLERNHLRFVELQGVLDFGCGCGRVIRHLAPFRSVGLHGCDINGLAIDWCQTNLPFGRFAVNGLVPPLPYGSNSFELVYAFSVFTHLTQDLQIAWMNEMSRVLKTGGYLIISTMGEQFLPRLALTERAAFEAGEMVVVAADDAGMNSCGAYHPERYVRTSLARDFEVLDFAAGGARGNPPQDVYLLRKPAAEVR